MAADLVILGDLTLSSAPYGISAENGHDFFEPQPELTMRARAVKPGNVLVKKRFPNAVRTLRVNVSSSDGTKDSLHANLRAIQTELRKLDVGDPLVLQYTPNGGSVDNFSDVIVGSRETALDWFYVVRNEVIKATLRLECEPFWRGSQITIAQQTFSPTPAVLTASTVQGDIETPVFVEIQAGSTNDFGNDLYVGTRKTPITEANFDPIKDFQGSSSGGTFNGEYSRSSISTGFTSLTGTNTNLNGVSFPTTNIGWICGDAGLIQKTTNSGNTWVAQASTLTSQNLLDLQFLSTNVGYACGNAGIFLKTTDAGVTWANTTSALVGAFNLNTLAFASSNVGWVGGAQAGGSVVILTTNAGVTWARKDSNPGWGNIKLNDLSVVDDNILYGIGFNFGSTNFFRINKTINQGSSWVSLFKSGIEPFGIEFPTSSVGWIVGQGGSIISTTDSAVAWSTEVSGTVNNLNAIGSASSSELWVVGDNGTILNTTDGGTTWNTQTSNTAANLSALSVLNSSDVYSVGDGFEVLRTDDGGTTWVQPVASWALSSVSDYRGRYRVFARVRSQSADPTTVSVRALSGFAGGTTVANDSVAMTVATDTWEVLDLGEINIPITRVSDEISPTPIVSIEALDTSGVTNFDIDVAVLLPIDGEAAFIDSGATQAEFVTLDSDSNAINKGFTRVTWNGSPPLLRPGLRNNIVILETSTGNSGGINDALVTMKYFARFLQPESSA